MPILEYKSERLNAHLSFILERKVLQDMERMYIFEKDILIRIYSPKMKPSDWVTLLRRYLFVNRYKRRHLQVQVIEEKIVHSPSPILFLASCGLNELSCKQTNKHVPQLIKMCLSVSLKLLFFSNFCCYLIIIWYVWHDMTHMKKIIKGFSKNKT